MDIEEQYDKVYRYCYMRVGHRQTAEDITQETFLRFFKNYSYQDMGKFMAYLYTIARNLCTDYHRKKKEMLLPEDYEEKRGKERLGVVFGESHEETVVVNLALREALSCLGQEEQEMILLRYVNELAVADIGKIFGLSRFTVHRRLGKCMAVLRKELGVPEKGEIL